MHKRVCYTQSSVTSAKFTILNLLLVNFACSCICRPSLRREPPSPTQQICKTNIMDKRRQFQVSASLNRLMRSVKTSWRSVKRFYSSHRRLVANRHQAVVGHTNGQRCFLRRHKRTFFNIFKKDGKITFSHRS